MTDLPEGAGNGFSDEEEAYIRSLEASAWENLDKRQDVPEQNWPFPRWDRYEFRAFQGQGAVGVVFKVFDPVLNRVVALKVLNQHSTLHASRFLAEARSQARVDHPHVAKVHEVGEVDGRPYLTMQVLKGQSLQILSEQLSVGDRVEVVRQACEGVQAAHSMGLLHRDIKPGNIVVERDGESHLHAYVVDFGMACEAGKESETGEEVMGTPAFMSPEQAAGELLDRRSDVFSLGSTLYYVLTGHLPFGGGDLLSILGKVALVRPKPLRKIHAGLPKDLEAIVWKAMEKDPSSRYPSARALSLDLKRWLEGEPVEAMAHQYWYRLERWVKKNRALAGAGILLTVTSLVAAAWGIRLKQRSGKEAYYYHYFAQEAKRMDAFLTLVEALPCHDTLGERQSLLNQIKHLELEIQQGGKVAKAPGLFAIGRGHMALENWDEARKALEGAWNHGLRTPETAFSLGHCLSRIYRLALRALAGQTREERQDELSRTVKPMIQHYLAVARQGTERTMVLFSEALLAHAERHYEEAHSKVDQVLHDKPREVPALLLKAEICLEQAGQNPPGQAHLEEAQRLLAKVQDIARSCARAYELEAQVWREFMKKKLYAGQSVEIPMERALAAVRKARLVHSRSWLSYQEEATIRMESKSIDQWYWAENEGPGGLPDTMRKVVQLADHALALNPQAMMSSYIKGTAYWYLAFWEFTQRLDPRKNLKEASQALTAALQQTKNSNLLQSLGNAYYTQGVWELAGGENPVNAIRKSQECWQKAVAIKNNTSLFYNLGLAHDVLATLQRYTGQDPRHEWLLAIWKSRQAIENTQNLPVMVRLSDYYLKMVEASLWLGELDRDILQMGRQYADQALAKAKDNPDALLVAAKVELLESFSGNKQADLAKGQRLLHQARAIKPKDPCVIYSIAWLELEQFRKNMSQAACLTLEKHIDEVMKLPETPATAHLLVFEACRYALANKLPEVSPGIWRQRMIRRLELTRQRNPLMAGLVEQLARANELKP